MKKINVEFPEKHAFLFQPAPFKVLYGGRAGLKCLAIGTQVIMHDGTLRNVEDVKQGECVMGPDSSPRKVLSTTRGQGKLFKVHQTFGQDYVVNEAHILSLKKSGSSIRDTAKNELGRYPSWPNVVNMPVTEVAQQSERWRYNFRGYRAGRLQFKHQRVSIDPYLLGVWLGDGTSREMRITTPDDVIIQHCRGVVESLGGRLSVCQEHKTAKNIGFVFKAGQLNPLWAEFKHYDLPNNKHIPQEFISNSVDVRMQLLAGLIDSDGTAKHHGYSICQVRENLARGIKYLADTLGFRTSIVKIKTLCHNNGKRGAAWRVNIGGPTWEIPCKVPHKQNSAVGARTDMNYLLSAISIEQVPGGDWAGFTLDGDHLFLLADGTVTHNSWSAARAALIMGVQRKLRFLCAREIQKSIAESVHWLLSSQIDQLGLNGNYIVRDTYIQGRNGTEFIFAGLKSDPRKIKSTEGVDIAIVEEAEKVSRQSWGILIPTIRKEGSEIWVILNPDDEHDVTYQDFIVHPPPGAVLCKTGWEDNIWLPADYLEKKNHAYRVNPEAADNIWGGNPRKHSKATIFAEKYIITDLGRRRPEWEGPYQGMDFGFSVDPNVFVRCWIIPNLNIDGHVYPRALFIEHADFGYHTEMDKLPALILTHTPDAKNYEIRGDNARPETVNYLKNHGLPRMVSCEKGKGSVEDGITYLLSFDVIVIEPRQKEMAEEAKFYSYKVDKNSDQVTGEIVDAFNHGWDAVRYAMEPCMKLEKAMDINQGTVNKFTNRHLLPRR